MLLGEKHSVHTWKQRNGTKATCSRLIRIFEQAGFKSYADEVRRIAELSDTETDDSSGSEEEQSQAEQPQTYPTHKQQQILCQSSPAIPNSTETYVIVDNEDLPGGETKIY